MYDHQKLIELQKKMNERVDKLLDNSELVCSDHIQQLVVEHLKSLIKNIESLSAALETIYLMNMWGQGTAELYNESPEEYYP